MISVLYIICTTIVICMAIRYACIWNCQRIEYKLYNIKNPPVKTRFNVRPYFFDGKNKGKESYWGYTVYDSETNLPYTGRNKNNTQFTVYKVREDAEVWCMEVQELENVN